MASCYRPIRLKSGQIVPCGRCPACKARYANQWSFRLQTELSLAKMALFVTLTYDDIHLPVNHARFSENGVVLSLLRKGSIYVGSNDSKEVLKVDEDSYRDALFRGDKLTHRVLLPSDYSTFFPYEHDVPSVCKSDVINYHKRLRHNFDYFDITIKYFTCSEYGSKSQRPHYHEILLFYGSDFDSLHYDLHYLSSLIKQCWEFGDSLAVPCSNAACVNYTTKYMRKCKKNVPIGASPTFQLMSKGLGRSFLEKNLDRLRSEGLDNASLYFISGVRCNLPRYYREKAFPDRNIMADNIKVNLNKMAEFQKCYHKWLVSHNYEDTIDRRFEYHSLFYNDSDLQLRCNSTKKPSTSIETL